MSEVKFLNDMMTRQMIIDTLCQGIFNTSDFIDDINYIIDKKINKSTESYNYSMYEDDKKVIELILPTFRRVWSKVFINLPPYFEYSHRRKEEVILLYQSIYNPDDFYDHFIKTIKETENCLQNFDNIDKSLAHVTLIVDDYIGTLIDKVKNCDNEKQVIRDSKLKRINR